MHHMLQRGQGIRHCPHFGAPVEILAAIAIAVRREHQLRGNLSEAVDNAGGAKVRRTARPDRADARRREEGDGRFRNIRHVGNDTVSGLDAELAHSRREFENLILQFRPADFSRRAFLTRCVDCGFLALPL